MKQKVTWRSWGLKWNRDGSKTEAGLLLRPVPRPKAGDTPSLVLVERKRPCSALAGFG